MNKFNERRRVVTKLDPVSMTQPDHKTNAIDLLRDYARGVPVMGRSAAIQYGVDDINIDRASVERLKVEAKDLVKVVEQEKIKAKNDQIKKTKNASNKSQQQTNPDPSASTSPTTGAAKSSPSTQPGTPQGT